VAKLVFGMMQSLDGYVAGVSPTNFDRFLQRSTAEPGGPQLPPPGEQLARHFNRHVRTLAGMVYGRRMYEVMRYWDDDQPEWDDAERDFAMQPCSAKRGQEAKRESSHQNQAGSVA
jgi:hypothetical protein